MHVFLALILLFSAAPAAPAAADPAPDDAVLGELHLECLDGLVTRADGETPLHAALSFAPGIDPAERVRTLTESFFTSRGYALTDSVETADRRFLVLIDDARVVVRKERGRYRRLFTVTVRVRCSDTGGTIFAAGVRERSRSDIIPVAALHRTDTSFRFSPSLRRIDAGGVPGQRILFSFLLFTAAIGWFGFR